MVDVSANNVFTQALKTMLAQFGSDRFNSSLRVYNKRIVPNHARQTVLGPPHLAVLARFQLAQLPGNLRMTRATRACMLHVSEERRHSRSSLTLRETAALLMCYRTGSAWLLFVRVNNGVDGSQRGMI